jgi:hypothetical protein
MATKKSLYEILQLAPDASYAQIRSAYEDLCQSLEATQSVRSKEDYDTQQRLLKLAYSTLATPLSRDAYDAQLASRPGVARAPSDALVATGPVTRSAAEIRAEAMLMRADAMSLRADAMGIRADSLLGEPQAGSGLAAGPIWSRLRSASKTALLTLGTLAAISMVVKIVFLFTLNRPSDDAGARERASEKVFLQDYYQTWGVRPANRAEADALDAERRAREDSSRTQRQKEEEKVRMEKAEREFEEESRRRGAQVSAELQFAEEKARLAQVQEDRQLEQARHAKEEAERRRIEAEQAKWRRILETPSNH